VAPVAASVMVLLEIPGELPLEARLGPQVVEPVEVSPGTLAALLALVQSASAPPVASEECAVVVPREQPVPEKTALGSPAAA